MRRLVTVLVLVFLTGGCGGGGSAGSSTSVTAPAPAASSPASAGPVALTVAQASARYLEIVKPYNTALEKFEDAAHAGTPWRSLRPLARRVAQANAVQARALRDTNWPVAVQAPMAALVAETDLAQRDWERVAAAKTADELAKAVQSAVRHDGSKPAGQIRTLLGLPPYSEA